MEPGSFKIKKVGEDLPSSENQVVENSESSEQEGIESPTIVPPSQQAKSPLRLANRSNVPLASSDTNSACPECNASIAEDAVMCVACGFNIKKGKNVNTKYKKAKKSKASFPNQQRSQSRTATKPSAFSNFLFMLVFFGGIGGGVWYFFFKPLPPVYGPHKVVDMPGAKFKPNEFEIVYDSGNYKNSVSINAWREMEAHFNAKKNTMHFEAKKNAKKYKHISMLTFKKPKSILTRKIEILFDSKDYQFLQQIEVESSGNTVEKINKRSIDYTNPKNVAVKFLKAFLMKDKNGIIESVLEDSADKILWEGQPASKSSLAKLDTATYRVPKEGEVIMAPYGKKILAYHVSFYKTTVIPVVGGKDTPYPIFLVDVSVGDGIKEWRVDPTIYITTIELKKKALQE